MLTNFLIIGVQKAGTTSLINYLAKHPDVFVPFEKEIPYFHRDAFYKKGIKYYKKFFKDWKGEKLVGHAPVNTLFYAKKAAKRIYDFNREMKLIVIFRNPIDRAYSHYWYCKRNCLEDALTFEEVIERELELLKQNKELGELQCVYYLSHGLYYDQIKEYLKYFPQDQMLFLLYEDMKKDLKSILKKVYSFLGIKDYFPEDLLSKKYNVASVLKIKILQKIIYRDNVVKDLYKSLVPETVRFFLKEKLIAPLISKNLQKIQYEPMKPSTRKFWQKFFKKPNKKLHELTRIDIAQWD